MPEDIVDLILEPTGQHLVGLVQHKLLDVVRPKHQQYHLLRLNFFFYSFKKVFSLQLKHKPYLDTCKLLYPARK